MMVSFVLPFFPRDVLDLGLKLSKFLRVFLSTPICIAFWFRRPRKDGSLLFIGFLNRGDFINRWVCIFIHFNT